MSKRITIIGGGSWGTAIASLLSDNNHQVLIYLRDKKLKEIINQENYNPVYFPEVKLSAAISATTDLEKALSFGEIIFLTIPTYATRTIMEQMKPYLKKEHILVSTAKGFEESSFLMNSEIIKEYTSNPVIVLSGPTHAEEVIKGLPSAVVVASDNLKMAQLIQDLMMSPYFRVYTNPDVVGVETGGAIKNVIAVASGITDGLGYGDNSRAALITRGLHEMSRLGQKLGGKLLTFAGLAGMGDLVVTCTSMYSRNRRLGIKIGQGLKLNEALKEINQAVEGVRTTRAIYNWCQNFAPELELPITNQTYQVLFNDKNPYQAVEDLMLRGPKHEIEEVVNDLNW
jgi:glycerol-3-phosphate dehydrogenase (NAD(P)+)